MEFKIGDQVLLHHTKAEKQWSEKFDPKWDNLFHIHEALGNGAYKLRLEDKILKKVAYGNCSTRTNRSHLYTLPEKKILQKKINSSQAGLEESLEKIKEALAYGTELPETEKLSPTYWFYKIGEQLDLKTLYRDFSQKTFNKKAIQQDELPIDSSKTYEKQYLTQQSNITQMKT
ncbi:hypothetical protein G9A89_009569 [Geosiphon pyriformis]|nr:hypothetical protein G9A89_009569 [Geosiphon pyriformis]